jgi:two-component system phosphate regulon response regulator PhoB
MEKYMAEDKRILIVEDEETLCEVVRFNLERAGYGVDIAYSAEDALKLPLSRYSLILLDIMMGAISGFTMAKMLKENPTTCDIPIIFCTAKDTEDDMITGLHLGADDYITKPYSIRALMARIEAVLRRANHTYDKLFSTGAVMRYAGIVVDTDLKTLTIDGKEIALPKKEYEILRLLLSTPGKIFSRDEILSKVWHNEVVVLDRTIDVNITRLRQKLGVYGKHIITRSGYGYGFQP